MNQKIRSDCGSDRDGITCVVYDDQTQIGYVRKENALTRWYAFITLPRGATGSEIRSHVPVGDHASRKHAVSAVASVDSNREAKP
jgi:hypothetical protein